MFKENFEKTALLTGAAIGALGGGEKDNEKGGKKNRFTGALRGVSSQFGASLGAAGGGTLGLMATKNGRNARKLATEMKQLQNAGKTQQSIKKMRQLMASMKGDKGKTLAALGVGALGGAVAGGIGGYKAMKKVGPQYDSEKKNK